MSVKKLHHICIQTSNYKESLYFYTEILGFEVIKETIGFHARDFNTWLEMDSFMIELQTPKKGDQFSPWSNLSEGIVHFAFIVDDVKKEYERIKSKGYDHFKIKNGKIIYEVENGKLFKIKAPEGTEIEIRDLSI